MLSWDLDKRLRPMMQYLIDCRPHSVSMGNAHKVRELLALILRMIGVALPKHRNQGNHGMFLSTGAAYNVRESLNTAACHWGSGAKTPKL